MFASVFKAGDQSRDFLAPFVGQMSILIMYIYTVHTYIDCIYRYTVSLGPSSSQLVKLCRQIARGLGSQWF